MRRARDGCVAALLGLSLCAAAYPAEPPASLRAQISQFADESGFVAKNLNRIGDEPVRSVGDDPSRQLRELLAGYDYVVIQGTRNVIQEVVILGRSVNAPVLHRTSPGSGAVAKVEQTSAGEAQSTDASRTEYKVALEWQGNMRAVDVLVFGHKGTQQHERLVVDVDGTAVVLPASLIDDLEFQEEELSKGSIQTAYGNLEAKLAKLKAVYIGQIGSRNVDVAFVDDDRLGDQGLIGLSALRDFSLDMDEINNELIAVTRRATHN